MYRSMFAIFRLIFDCLVPISTAPDQVPVNYRLVDQPNPLQNCCLCQEIDIFYFRPIFSWSRNEWGRGGLNGAINYIEQLFGWSNFFCPSATPLATPIATMLTIFQREIKFNQLNKCLRMQWHGNASPLIVLRSPYCHTSFPGMDTWKFHI